MDANQSGNPCQKYEALLEDYLGGGLDRVAAEPVAAHLEVCPSCREALAAAGVSARLLRASREPTNDPGPSFAQRVMVGIRAEEALRAAEAGFWSLLEIPAWRLAWTAALALAVLLTYGYASRVAPAPQMTIARQTSVRDIFPEPVQRPTSRDEVLLNIAETNHGK